MQTQAIYKLANPSFSIPQEMRDNSIEVEGMLMYEEDFIDAAGQPFSATGEFLNALSSNYNDYVRASIPDKAVNAIKKVLGRDIPPRYAPVIIDHDSSTAVNCKGYVKSLRIEECDGECFLFGTYIIIGDETIKKMKEGAFREMSVAFGEDENGNPQLREVSFVLRGAVPGASVLMSQYEKKKRINRITAWGRELEDSCVQLAQTQLELKTIKHERRSHREMGSRLNSLVKKGQISLAAKKALYYQLSDCDKKTQNKVFEALQSVNRYATVQRGHQANVRDAMKVEEMTNRIARGENMANEKEGFNRIRQGIREKVSGKEVTTKPASEATGEFSQLFNEIAIIKREVRTFKKLAEEKQATIDQMTAFLNEGKFKKATKLAREFSTSVDDETEEDVEDDKDTAEEVSKAEQERVIRASCRDILTKMIREFKEDKDYKDCKDGDDEDGHEYMDDEDDEDDEDDKEYKAKKKMKSKKDMKSDEDDEDDKEHKAKKKKMKAKKKMKSKKDMKSDEDDDKDDADD